MLKASYKFGVSLYAAVPNSFSLMSPIVIYIHR